MRKLKFALVFNLILICNICVSQDIKLQKSLIFDDTHKHELMQYNGLHGLYKKMARFYGKREFLSKSKGSWQII